MSAGKTAEEIVRLFAQQSVILLTVLRVNVVLSSTIHCSATFCVRLVQPSAAIIIHLRYFTFFSNVYSAQFTKQSDCDFIVRCMPNICTFLRMT